MFPLLFSPLTINGVTVRNRIVSTAHNTGLNDGLRIGDRLRAYYEARARGGVGLMIMGSTSVHPSSTSRLRFAFANWSDDVIGEYASLSRLVASHGARIFAQLNHAGAGAGVQDGGHLVAPSAVRSELSPETPRALEMDEIGTLVEAFAKAAARAREGGMHGVELHGGHGNLIQQFLSPLTNHRDDAFGGSFDKRMRFGLDVARAVRAAVGPDFVVGLRISVKEDHEGGLTIKDSRRIVPAFVAAGALDYVNVTSGSDLTSWSLANHYASMYVRSGFLRPLARQIREVVSVPVLASGRITDPRDAEDVLASGDADLVGMTRALIADRDLPAKAKRGAPDTIRSCVGANDGCLGRLFRGLPITCIQDPTSGRESELGPIEGAPTSRRVVVVGGGAAGLEAARVAALRGHQVTLLERDQELGGQIRLARRAPGREEIGAIVDHLVRELADLAVEIRTGVDATAELISGLAPDAVILASGSRARVPILDDSEDRLVSAREAIEGALLGDTVAVFDTVGDHAGMTTADLMVQQRRKVVFVTSHRVPGGRIDAMTGQLLYKRLLDGGVAFHTESEVARFTDEGVEIRHVVSGGATLLPDVVTVIAACGGTSNDGIFHDLQRSAPNLQVLRVGDALAPRLIEQAIYDGHMAARQI